MAESSTLQLMGQTTFGTSAEQVRVWAPPAGTDPHQCNAFCRGRVHATLMFTDCSQDFSLEDIQAMADVLRAGRRPVTVLAIERASEAVTPPERPYAWTVWAEVPGG